MKKIIFALLAFALFSSHIMYLKFDSYFLEPNSAATIELFNGTFDKSENVIDRNRMLDASLVGNGTRIKVDDSQWSEKDSTITVLNFQTGDTGTWVAGVSTKPNSIAMTATEFNTYLEHEGIPDMLEWRRENDKLDEDAVEKYSKHVKTIFQVGDTRTDDWKTNLGYPIEFIPTENPYDLNTGDSLTVKLVLNGEPLADQLVYADFKAPANEHSHDTTEEQGHSHDDQAEAGHSHDTETEEGHSHGTDTEEGHSHDTETEEGHSHGTDTEEGHSHDTESEEPHSHDPNDAESHQHTSGQELRTDNNGMVTAALTADGIWYLQTIHLVTSEEEGITHESNWTTLTFEVVHAHGADTHTHDNEEEEGIPSYLYWIGSILLVGILFFLFNRKNK